MELVKSVLLVWALLAFLALSFALWYDAFILPAIQWYRRRKVARQREKDEV